MSAAKLTEAQAHDWAARYADSHRNDVTARRASHNLAPHDQCIIFDWSTHTRVAIGNSWLDCLASFDAGRAALQGNP